MGPASLPGVVAPEGMQIWLGCRGRIFSISTYGYSPYIDSMKRTTIWLTDAQIKQLARVSKKRGIPIAELIRRYIDRGLERER